MCTANDGARTLISEDSSAVAGLPTLSSAQGATLHSVRRPEWSAFSHTRRMASLQTLSWTRPTCCCTSRDQDWPAKCCPQGLPERQSRHSRPGWCPSRAPVIEGRWRRVQTGARRDACSCCRCSVGWWHHGGWQRVAGRRERTRAALGSQLASIVLRGVGGREGTHRKRETHHDCDELLLLSSDVARRAHQLSRVCEA